MSDKKISFDVDGVLANFTSNVTLVANSIWPGKVPAGYAGPYDWNYTDIFTKDEWNTVWSTLKTIPDFWFRQEAYNDSVNALKEFKKFNTNPIWFITSRITTGNVTARYQTQIWLMKHGIIGYGNTETSRVIAVDRPEDKDKWIKEFGIDVSIDDLAPTVIRHNAEIPGHTAYLLRRPWNTYCTDQPTVNSVKEFLDII